MDDVSILARFRFRAFARFQIKSQNRERSAGQQDVVDRLMIGAFRVEIAYGDQHNGPEEGN